MQYELNVDVSCNCFTLHKYIATSIQFLAIYYTFDPRHSITITIEITSQLHTSIFMFIAETK